jgi:hypothetical protein
MKELQGIESTCKPDKVTPIVYGLGARVNTEEFDNGNIIPTSSMGEEKHLWDSDCLKSRTHLPVCRLGRANDYENVPSNCEKFPIGKTFLKEGHNSLKCTDPGEVEVRALDCTGFVMAAIANAGIRIIPGSVVPEATKYGAPKKKTPPEYWNNHRDKYKSYFWIEATKDFLKPSEDDSTCFKYPSKTEPQLKPGDIFQWKANNGNGAEGHIGIISDVSDPEDPFGFISDDDIKDVSDCENIDPSNFNFTIAHSTGDFGGLGPMIINWNKSPQKNNKGMIAWAKKACEIHYSKGDEFTHGKTLYSNKKFHILRHKGTEKCKLPTDKIRPKIPKEDCMRRKCQKFL